ncbi:MAG: hypothetical protein ACFFCS_07755 [Candidatus Hodarchaeota archaeon]
MLMEPGLIPFEASTDEKVIDRDEKIDMAFNALRKKDYNAAITLFREIIVACVQLKDFDLAYELIHRLDSIKSLDIDKEFIIINQRMELSRLQRVARQAYENKKYHWTKVILKQMLDIAKQLKDPILIDILKAYIKRVKDDIKKAKKKYTGIIVDLR